MSGCLPYFRRVSPKRLLVRFKPELPRGGEAPHGDRLRGHLWEPAGSTGGGASYLDAPSPLETLLPQALSDPKSEQKFLTWDVLGRERCVTPPAVSSTLGCVCTCLRRGSLCLWLHKGQDCEYSRRTGVFLNKGHPHCSYCICTV